MRTAIPAVRSFGAFVDDSADALYLFYLLELGSDEEDFFRLSGRRVEQINALRQAWLGYTVQSGDHHDVHNLIAPFVLDSSPARDSAAGSEMSLIESALISLTRLFQLSPRSFGMEAGWAIKPILSDAKQAGGIDVVLLDDQASRWSHFVRRAFCSGNVDVRYSSLSNPMEILGRLRELISIEPLTRTLVMKDSPTIRESLILLDLRFFREGDSSERAFFTEVCRFAEDLFREPVWKKDPQLRLDDLSVRDYGLLSLPVFGGAAPLEGPNDSKPRFLRAATRVLECEEIGWDSIRETRLYDSLLTLFPRVIAHVLFSSPIVLFSSTGRRDLTEYLKPYRNIITVFEKPRLPVDTSKVTQSLKSAVVAAMRLIKAKRLLRSWTDQAAVYKPPAVDAHKYYHVELFIDEHYPYKSQENIWVGGFYAVFEGNSAEEAKLKSDGFDQDSYNNGVAYYSRGDYAPTVQTKDKGTAAERALQVSLRESRDKPRWTGRVRLRSKEDLSAGGLPGTGDDRYRRSLSTIIEVFLCEVMSRHFARLSPSSVSFSVFAGTRVTKVEQAEHDKKQRMNDAAYHWGFEVTENGDGSWRLESMNRSALAPIVGEIVGFRGVEFEIERALAVRMIYDSDPHYHKGEANFEPNGQLRCLDCRFIAHVRLKAKMALPDGL